MKRAAAILLFLFAFVQAAPAVCSLFDAHISVFLADEEKGDAKTDDDVKKEKKDFTAFLYSSAKFSHKVNTAIHLAEKIGNPPCLEKLTPPPNFC